jgi:hypothetical protein
MWNFILPSTYILQQSNCISFFFFSTTRPCFISQWWGASCSLDRLRYKLCQGLGVRSFYGVGSQGAIKGSNKCTLKCLWLLQRLLRQHGGLLLGLLGSWRVNPLPPTWILVCVVGGWGLLLHNILDLSFCFRYTCLLSLP